MGTNWRGRREPSVTCSKRARRLAAVAAMGVIGGLLPTAPFIPGTSSVIAENNPAETMIRYGNVFYAYTQPGEHLDVSFVKYADVPDGVAQDKGALSITVRGPDGAIRDCDLDGEEAVGFSCEFDDLTAAEAGAWEVNFAAPSGGPIGAPSADYYTWDIRVQTAASADLPGRVWVEQYVMAHDPLSPESGTDFSLWYQSEQGYRYRADYDNYNGLDSVFSSNATGVALKRDGGCISAYESIDVGGDYADDAYYLTTTECGDRYKIFFASPDLGLPQMVELPDGTSTWLRPPVVLPRLTNLAFAQDQGNVRSGRFTFQAADFTGNAVLQIDADGNGSYADAVDRSINFSITTTGLQSRPFDGLDALGNEILTSTPINARVQITKVGEIHFALEDAEMRGGLEVTALNGPDVNSKLLYWNDTKLRLEQRSCWTPDLDGRNGANSAGGVHGWDCIDNANDGESGSWGDYRVIDDWTFQTIDSAVAVSLPAIPQVTVTKQVIGEPTFDSATGQWTIDYDVTVVASGVNSTTYDLDDRLMFGPDMHIDSATITAEPGTPAPDPAWNGQGVRRVVTGAPIAAGDEHLYHVKAVTTLTAAQGGTVDDCRLGEDFYNRATIRPVGGDDQTADACAEPEAPDVVLDKEVDPPTYDSDSRQYTVTYTVSATATGTGQAFYTLDDALDFGPNVDIDTVSITPSGGSPTPEAGWNGQTNTAIVTDQPIVGGDTDVWTIVVVAHLLPTWSAAPTCAAGTDFFNRATMTITGDSDTQTDEACAEPVTPTVEHEKRSLGAVWNPGSGTYTVTYEIEVMTKGGQGTAFYDLSDAFQFGDAITIVGTPTVEERDGIATIAGWDGQTDTAIVDDQPISGGDTDLYTITVEASVLDAPQPGACLADEDFFNESTLVSGGSTQTSWACEEPGLPALTHRKEAVGIRFDPATGEYVIDYTLTVSASGPGSRSYQLFDALDFPANVAVTSTTVSSHPDGVDANPSWNGGTDPLVAGGVTIDATEPHIYTIEVRAVLTGPNAIPNVPGSCSAEQGDFANTSEVLSGTRIEARACIERPQPDVTLSKTLSEPVELDPTTGVYTLTYLLEQRAVGADGQTYYDLDDAFDFGPTVDVVFASATSPDATLVPGWDGTDNTRLVEDQPITTGETDRVTVVVQVKLTGPTPGNNRDECTPGRDLHNDATLDFGGPRPVGASACAELPAVRHTKSVESGPMVVAGSPGRYTISYVLTESAPSSNDVPVAYDLTDELRFGPEVSIVGVAVEPINPTPLPGLQAGWDGQANTLLVDDGVLQPGDTHTVRVIVTFDSLVPDPPDADDTVCSGDGTGLDEDLANTSTQTSNLGPIVDTACAPAPHPGVDHTKTLDGEIIPNGDGTYTAVYEIAVTNSGDGAGVYDLADTFRFGAGVAVAKPPLVVTDPIDVDASATWNGESDTVLVAGQAISPGAVHTYRITVVIRPDADATVGAATDCMLDPQETGTGLRNESALLWAGTAQQREACGEVPHIGVDKAISAGPTDLGNGRHQVGYTITVTNDGAGAGTYTVADQLAYGANVSVVSIGAVNTAPGTVTINPAWDGQSNDVLAMGVPLAAGDVHTYVVTVIASVATTTVVTETDCTLDVGETGTGLLNTATIDQNGTEHTDLACAEVSPPPPPDTVPTTPPPTTPPPTVSTPVSPAPPPTSSQIPATGGNSTALTAIGLALVGLGALVVLLTRRRRPVTSQ